MNDIELYIYVIVAALIISGLMYFYLKTKGFIGTKFNDNNHAPKQIKTATDRLEEQRVYRRQQMSAHYQPKDFGHRTGKYRVFNTNKGLRTYEINNEGYPLPPKNKN